MGWFGKKIEIEVPDGRGGAKKVKILEKQFDKWVSEGKISRIATGFTVHILDPAGGERQEMWKVGDDIDEEEYKQFKETDGSVYAAVVYRQGEPHIYLLKKNAWLKLKREAYS